MEKEIEIGFLGTGGSVATEERDNTALVIRYGTDLFLIDCPGGIFQKLKRMSLDPRRVTSILVTHVHPDHIYGLPIFVHGLMLDELCIRLYASAESIQFCRELLDLFQLQSDKIKCRLEFVAVGHGDRFLLGPELECQARHVPHTESSLAFIFNLRDRGRIVVYSGDTPLHPPLFKAAAGCDLLIHDCSIPSRLAKQYEFLPRMHTHALDLGRLAQEARVKRLAPVHFFGELDYSIAEIEAEIRRHYTGELILPSDLLKITI